ncbi:carboxylic acid reductase [Streptomyces sp. C11-1]|uniref:Carboxylic acid reductase n=1 Tax=Streptomyces durocortorensis TaxID=2811104 RepID=A0ABY9WDG4_9ACTN|nr:carboxylic acid reductase [Streptomyces durocortorensis]WNF31381.1 carboxylic acid reductase [Streptomyces durocortorensis]
MRRFIMRLARVMADIMEQFAERPALGERAKELVEEAGTGRTRIGLLPRYEMTTYGELWQRVRSVASAWHHDGSPYAVRAGDRVAILGFASIDYTTVDLACAHLGAVSVPLQTSSAVSQLNAIVEETEPVVVATSIERLDTAVELALANPSVRRLVLFDYVPEVDDQSDRFTAARERLAEHGREPVIELLEDVRARGAELPQAPLFDIEGDEDPLAMLIYTSGSTGTPKGAMYTERLARAMWGGAWSQLFSDEHAANLHYMPMSHVAGHSSLKNTLARGGTTYFTANSDLSSFLEDMALARPTEMSLVPRVCEMLFQKYQSELDRRSAKGGDGDLERIETEVRKDIRENVLGGRVGWASCGSAPLSAELKEFTESLLGIEVHIIYGSTEAAAVSVDGKLLKPPVIDHKLVDVPELGYYRTDSPHPRGELLLKTEAMVPGYYKRPDLNAEIFDEDGYYRTGDIVAETEPGRHVVVDRRKNVLKLSQGEFVATSRLEAVFAVSPLVRQIFVYGNSERSYLLSVVVPTTDALEQSGDDETTLKKLLGESFQEIAKEVGLNSYEIPRDFLIETEPFSQSNGLLSDHRKLLRPQLLEKYRPALEETYSAIASREKDELRDVRRGGKDRPALETVQRAAQALLSTATSGIGPGTRFREIGGDSMSAVTFSDLLYDIFGIRVPVDVIISRGTDLRRIAGYVEEKLAAGPGRVSFASVHTEGSTRVRAVDLTLDKFIDEETRAAAPALLRTVGQPRTVLLTGASGYLGRFLCLEWLRRLAPVGGKLICVVRGSDDAAALARLVEAFGDQDGAGDGEPARTFQDLARDHLEVLAGDMAEPRLGLDEQVWQRLSGEVDRIVHAGALVNHVLPYNHLFDANVVGTAELIRLGLTGRLKPFTYISSVAVAASLPGGGALDEDSDVRVALPDQPVDDGYASGYATSKWAGEVLLREAHDLYGLPVTTFRSNMILAHTGYAGQLNVTDMFTRLLLSLIVTGIAPRSFYETDGTDRRPRAHYDGLPVDFTAEAVVTLGGEARAGYRTYSLVNPHDDGISLDTFVDWLNEAGHRIDRVEDYDDWLARFETALRAAPEPQRKHSILPLLDAHRTPEPVISGSAIPSARFQAAVKEAGLGPTGAVPQLSPAFIKKYAEDLGHLIAP